MPIVPTLNLKNLTDDEFDRIDAAVMRLAYVSQNKLSRLFEEHVYENDLALRLRAEGFEVHTQVPIAVTLGIFEKTYYLDLVVNHMLYELKVVQAWNAAHQAQVLHYAMLQDIRRAKLVNFRSARVMGDLHYNPLTNSLRHRPRWTTREWRPTSEGCESLLAYVQSIVSDWGTHLDSRLYQEAIIHHFGGELECLQRLPVVQDGTQLGSHLVQLHALDSCFVVTAIHRHSVEHRRHLQRQLEGLPLKVMQWINFNHSCIEFTTISKE